MIEKLTLLRTELHQHIHNYYVLNRPTITDEEYDKKFKELVDLETRYPEFSDRNSPTARVGHAPISNFKKIKHAVKMLSLNNAFTADEVVKFLKYDGAIVAEHKIDGLSLSLRYKDGELVEAVTRGDGFVGDDVTENARTISSIPLKLSKPISTEVRGEVYMSKSVFHKINDQLARDGDEPFANARNAASGTMKLKDSRQVAERGLSFFAYYLMTADKDKSSSMLTDDITELQELGFITTKNILIRANAEELDSIICSVSNERSELDYDIDGIVFKINNKRDIIDKGEGTRSPNWAVAYKFPPEVALTKLLGITCQVGRFGTITPVAELKPVPLSGAIVKRASLCNQDEIRRLGINIGDIVQVSRAADVIPKIIGAKVFNSNFWIMPETCPSCGKPITRVVNQTGEEGANYRCTNADCKEQVLQRLGHAVSKGALNFDGVGPAYIEHLFNNHGVRTLSDLMSINIAESSAVCKKFCSARETAKSAPLWRKLYALGIENVGQTLCKDICSRYKSLEEMLCPELVEITGKVAYSSFVNFMSDNVDEIDKLASAGFTFNEPKSELGPLSGKTFVITGALVSGKRHEVSATIEKYGGTMKGSVSKKVDYLVVGADPGAGKTDGAKKYGTRCISEEELYRDLIGIPMPVAELQQIDEF